MEFSILQLYAWRYSAYTLASPRFYDVSRRLVHGVSFSGARAAQLQSQRVPPVHGDGREVAARRRRAGAGSEVVRVLLRWSMVKCAIPDVFLARGVCAGTFPFVFLRAR